MKKLLIGFALLLGITSTITVVTPHMASAQFNPIEETCNEANADSELCRDASGNDDLVRGEESVINTIANILAIAGGIIAVIVIIIAGITMITSGGDPQKVSGSKNAIIYAAIGLIVIVLARSLVFFVINLIG